MLTPKTVACSSCGRECSTHLIACPDCGTPVGYTGQEKSSTWQQLSTAPSGSAARPGPRDELPGRTPGEVAGAIVMRVGMFLFLAPILVGLLLLGLLILPEGLAVVMWLLVLPGLGLLVAGAALFPEDWLGAGLGLSFAFLVLFLVLGGWKALLLLLWIVMIVFS